jgi:hypothetical protein
MKFWTWCRGNFGRVSAAITATLIGVVTTPVAPAYADPCAHLSGYAYVHCSTNIEGRKAISDHWNSLTERQQYLTRVANNAVEEFVRQAGRLPAPQLDRNWLQAVAQHAGIRSQEEATFFLNAIASNIRSTQTLKSIDDDACAAVLHYSGLGFEHIYRGIMPECFAR